MNSPASSAALLPAAEFDASARDYIDNLVHELGTPLTVLLAYVHAARDVEWNSPHAQEYFNRIERQGERMQRIIGALQDLSVLSAHPEAPCDERVDIMGVLAEIRAEAQVLSARRHDILLDATTGLDVLGVTSDIACAFRNLTINAVRYTPRGGRIEIVWRASRGGAEFIVEDSGIGIAREHIPYLTERFYRVERTRSPKPEGTGLGLAIVKSILDRYHATLDIRSTPGKGSRFTVRFPAERTLAAHSKRGTGTC